MTVRTHLIVVGAMAFLAGALGCSSSSNNNDGGSGGSAASGGHGGKGGGGGLTGGGGTTAAGGNGGVAAASTDAQIAGIALAANSGEVSEAQLAESKSTNSAVLQFAAMMITDHTAAIDRLQQVLRAQSLTTADSAERQALTAMTTQTINTLFGESGAMFDKTYAASQVTAHQAVLALFDQKLITGAQNAALRSELQMERTAVMTHLTMAQALVSTLSPDAGTSTGAGGAAGAGGSTGAGGAAGAGGAGGSAGAGGQAHDAATD
jgi:putative membrane protein